MHIADAIYTFGNETETAFTYSMIRLLGTDLLAVERAMATALQSYGEVDQDVRARIRNGVDLNLAARFLSLSVRLASESLKSRSEGVLLSAAMALTLDNELTDWRDILRALAIINDAALRMGLDPNSIISDAAVCATPTRTAVMDGFLRGPDYMKSLSSMAVSLEQTPCGLQYTFV